jgi:hypothetical protein
MITFNPTSARYSGVSVDFQDDAVKLTRLERVLFISFYPIWFDRDRGETLGLERTLGGVLGGVRYVPICLE